MGAADRDGHPADPDRKRITPKRSGMERLNHYFRIETELAEAGRFLRTEQRPIHHRDSAATPESELIESESEVGRGRLYGHCCD